jgi:methylated-DNA-[protein]-cysteine S-methyltransferase
MTSGTAQSISWFDVETPIGVIRLEGNEECLTGLKLPGSFKIDPKTGKKSPDGALKSTTIWLQSYFAGENPSVDDLKLPEFKGFIGSVYKALLSVPSGETVSYGELANMAGYPGAARAVGRAMATNPIALIIPCHRVLASDGTLHGYGGGLEMKRKLLEHEGASIK